MADRELAFVPRGERGFTIRVGDRDCSEWLDARALVACRDRAQQELEVLTAELAERIDDGTCASRAGWLFTPDYRRPDDFQGVFGWLFLFAVAERLKSAGCRPRARVPASVPQWAVQRLAASGFEAKVERSPVRARVRRIRLLHNAWQAMQFSWRHARLMLRERGHRSPPADQRQRSVLVKTPREGIDVRYGPLTSALDEAGFRIVGENFDLEGRGGPPTAAWRLSAWLSSRRIAAALIDAIGLKRRLGRLRETGPRQWLNASPLLEPSLFALARRMLQLRLWRAALSAGRPEAAVLVTSLTRPEDRLLIDCLHRACVPVALVLPRPLNPDRPAEKLLAVDFAHPATLPDLYIVRDCQSRDALAHQGVARQRIAVGASRMHTAPVSQAAESGQPRILVLLTVLQSANTALSRMLADALGGEGNLDVIVRCHPSVGVDEPARAALDRLESGWREQPGAALADQARPGTLALTATSTAAIQAAHHGAGVVWAPFVSEIALFQRRFMQQLGVVAENEAELVGWLRNLVADHEARNRLAEACHQAARDRFAAERTISEAVVEWLDGN